MIIFEIITGALVHMTLPVQPGYGQWYYNIYNYICFNRLLHLLCKIFIYCLFCRRFYYMLSSFRGSMESGLSTCQGRWLLIRWMRSNWLRDNANNSESIERLHEAIEADIIASVYGPKIPAIIISLEEIKLQNFTLSYYIWENTLLLQINHRYPLKKF